MGERQRNFAVGDKTSGALRVDQPVGVEARSPWQSNEGVRCVARERVRAEARVGQSVPQLRELRGDRGGRRTGIELRLDLVGQRVERRLQARARARQRHQREPELHAGG